MKPLQRSKNILLEVFPGLRSFIISLIMVIFTILFGASVFRKIFPDSRHIEQRIGGFLVFFSISYIIFLLNLFTDGFALINSKYIIFLVIIYSSYSMLQCFRKNGKLINRKNFGLFVIIGIAVVVYSQPILLSQNGIVWIGGDMRRHIQNIIRLTLGYSRPGGVYSPQYMLYPWLFHSSIAIFATFYNVFRYPLLESVFQAYNVINITTIIWGVYSINALSTLFFKRKREQLLTTLFGSLSGGLGYLFYRGGNILSGDPFGATYGDMRINYSYNGSLILVSPAWPRHFGYVIYMTSLYFLFKTIGNERIDRYHILLSAVSLGLAGVTQPIPCIVVAFALILMFIYKLTKGEFNFTIVKISIISFLIFSPYIAFIFMNYDLRRSFLITLWNPIDLPIYQYVTAIGLVFIFSLVGLYDYFVKNKINENLNRNEALPFFLLSFIIIIIFSIFHSYLGLKFTVFGEYLFRQHKYWYLFYPILCLYATLGYTFVESVFEGTPTITFVFDLFNWGKQKMNPKSFFIKMKPYKSVLLAIIILLGLGSPVLTSNIIGKIVSQKEDVIKTVSDRSDESLLFHLGDKIDKYDVIATPPTDESLTQHILAFTGAYVLYSYDYRVNYSSTDLEIQNLRYRDCVDLYDNFTSADLKTEILNRYSVDYIISNKPVENIDVKNVEYFGKKEFLNAVYYLYILKTS